MDIAIREKRQVFRPGYIAIALRWNNISSWWIVVGDVLAVTCTSLTCSARVVLNIASGLMCTSFAPTR